jgi:hypothetical protein
MSIGVRPAEKADVRDLSGVLGRDFYDDPVMMWMLPNNNARAKSLPCAFAIMARHHFLAGGGAEVASSDGVIGGATLWDPPGRWKMTPREEWLMKPGFIWAFRGRALVGEQVMEIMKDKHPEEPHWYLMMIGDDTSS